MKSLLSLALSAVLVGTLSLSWVDAQTDKQPAPIIIKASAHTSHFHDFQMRRNKDRSLETEIQKKGLDVAFTEWMQKDHPYIFASECSKHVGDIAVAFKNTPHTSDFDTLVTKRSDLRLNVAQYGHDVAFAEWLRSERPDVYRAHFNIKSDKPDKTHPPKGRK